MITFLSVISLLIVLTACAAAVLSDTFADNWLQHIGIWVVGLWAMLRLLTIQGGYVPDAMGALAYFGVALYSVGTWAKVWEHRHQTRAQERRHKWTVPH